MDALLKKSKIKNTTLKYTDKIGVRTTKGNGILFTVAASFMTLLVLYCLSRIIIDSFGILSSHTAGKNQIFLSKSKINGFWITSFFLCIPILAVNSLRKYRTISTAAVVAVYISFFLRNFKSVSNGFIHALNLAMNTIADVKGKGGDIYFITDFPVANAENELIMFLMAVIFGVCFLLAYSAVSRSSPLLFTSIVVLFAAVPFWFNVFEGEKYLVAAAISCIAVYICSIAGSGTVPLRNDCQLPFDKSVRINGIYSSDVCFLQLLCVLICVILILTPLNIFFDFSSYKRSERTMQLGEDILDVAETIAEGDIDLLGNSRNKLSSGDLTRAGDIVYTGDVMFEIADFLLPPETLYLKTYTGAEYNSKRWGDLSSTSYKVYSSMWKEFEAEDYYPQCSAGEALLRSDNIEELLNVFSIRNKKLNHKMILTHTNLLPNNSAKQLLLNNTFEYDKSPVFPAFGDEKTYCEYFYSLEQTNRIYREIYFESGLEADINSMLRTGQFVYPGITDDDEFYKNEALYRAFVTENYLGYPSNIDSYLPNGYDEFISDAFVYSQRDGNSYSVNEYYSVIIQYIRTYLDSHARYTLTPGDTPVGRDFTEYFLNENKKGYCVHFATAGTLLLRRAGIPARYAEGFVVGEDVCSMEYDYDDVIEVPDSCAHAWAEVYFPIIGWQPVEFTPSYYHDYNTSNNEIILSSETDTQDDSEDEEQTDKNSDESENNELSDKKETDDQIETGDFGLNITPKKAALGAVLITVGYILYYALKLAGWLLLRWLFIKLREKRFNEENTKISARALYRHSLFLLRVCGIRPETDEGDIDFAKRAMEKINREYTALYKTFTQTAQQAKFAHTAPTSESIAEMNDFIKTLTEYIYESSGKIKKLIMKYVLFLI